MRIDQMHYNFDLEVDRIASNANPYFAPWEKDEYLNKAIWKFLKDRYKIDPRTKKGFETDQSRISQLATLHIKSPELQPAVEATKLDNGIYEVNLDLLGDDINGQFFRYLFLTNGYIKARKGNCETYIDITQWQSDDDVTIYTDSSWTWRRVTANFGKSTYNHPVIDQNVVRDDSNDTTALLDVNNRYSNDKSMSLYFNTLTKYFEEEFEVLEVYLSYIKYPNRVFIGGYDHIDTLSRSDSPQIHCDIDDGFHDEIVRIAARLALGDIQDQLGLQIGLQKTLEDSI